ncbi:MAG: LAGLIDADG family homing endonuclease [Candidatus Portnoybacteria bacterium]|nr:LAGLIDADG family homing endonuclease [Candidatus Portnoybacteria bacterium]
MAELANSKRVFFPKGEQNKLINKILLKISTKEAANLCSLSERTIRDWRREKFSMDFQLLRKLCRKTNIPIPSNIKLKDRWWYVHLGASIGGKIVWEKYGTIGNPEYRKKKWHEWWEREGKFKKHPIINICKSIKKPRKSKDLAEFVGITLGDGGIAKRQLTITLHYRDDKEYGTFVVNLVKRLFNVPISKYYRQENSTNSFVISRTELIKFCVEKLGLKIGNKIKQQVDIPDWIKQNKQYSIACVRGLIDTDGSIINHCYKVSGKQYSYKKLNFTSLSKPLIKSVFQILKNNGLNPRISRNKDIWLDSKKNMEIYFRIFESHNPKHLKRYLK